MLGPDDPRQIGGRYRCGYWGREYTVLAFPEFDDWRGRSITVRWEEPCAWHTPCVHAYTVTHSTAWDARVDRVLRKARVRWLKDVVDGPIESVVYAFATAPCGVGA